MEMVMSEPLMTEFSSMRSRPATSEELVGLLYKCCEQRQAGAGLQALTDYVGALHYLLARCDLNSEAGLDYIVSSNWPFDLVRCLGGDLIAGMSRRTELDRCLSILAPAFALLPDHIELSPGISRQYCSMSFNVGINRYVLMLLCPQDVILSQQRLRTIGVLAGYFAGSVFDEVFHPERELDMTEREVECLFWIAEGKTSDEIATILGISRNTINNYITSIMRKTATRTRSEAIAYAVRHNLV